MTKKNKVTKKEVTVAPPIEEQSLSIAIEEVPTLYRKQMIAWQKENYNVGKITARLLAEILDELRKQNNNE